jgi:acetylglutamate kinase
VSTRRVIKLGGRVQGDPRLAPALAQALARGDRICIVHGGGDELSALQRRLGITPAFRDGRRVTSDEDLDLARMTLSGLANKRLVAELARGGVPAIGISGEDGGLLLARALARATLGAVGTPVRVDPAPIDALESAGFLPVVSPLARDVESGEPLNVNGDDAAAAIAAALGADELLLVADVPGVLDAGVPVSRLDSERIAALVADGRAVGGMVAKLEAAQRALAAGVAAVRIGDLEAITSPDAGTAITLASTPLAVRP